ncbi:Uridine kinase-like protein 3 [Carex littledalei]|uniref:uridine/cytidine kinase n=1 Tax=Carex littledalei TaxID=544730 RepID=A0A833RW51_9POAL|nr:Uridine kinase-like protein 3 [Carex littledalei]
MVPLGNGKVDTGLSQVITYKPKPGSKSKLFTDGILMLLITETLSFVLLALKPHPLPPSRSTDSGLISKDQQLIMGSRSGKSSPKVSSMENNHKEPFIIGVAGGAASGKTTVCDIITQQLHGQQIIESFYYGLSEKKVSQVQGYNFDHPDAFDTERLLSCLKSLKCGNEADIPNYDFKTYEKVFPERKVSPSDVIILEGILVFHDPRLRELMNMKIFVDTDADVRLAQRIHRDTVEKGRAVTVVLEQVN